METPTAEGQLYRIDTRLRPDGRAGQLVCSLAYLRAYLAGTARIWEHQALIRARPVAGGAGLARQFAQTRTQILRQRRDADTLRREFAGMRARMLQERPAAPGRFHLKSDPGGVTDIEFLVHYNVLLHAHAHPELARLTPTVQILDQLAQSGLLPAQAADMLRACYFAFRNRIHELNLQEQEPLAPAEEFAPERAQVRALWREAFGADA